MTYQFRTESLALTASAYLLKGFTIECAAHENARFPGHRQFIITPTDKAIELEGKFRRDEILFPPRLLSETILYLKNIPIKEEK